MGVTGKKFCDTHYRHLRILFLVDKNVSSQFLIDLFMDNYQLWGGRYNPVIPVYEKDLRPYYKNLIDNFDPDIVYYSENIGIKAAEIICKNIHPKELLQLDSNGRNNFPGVRSHYLLPEAHLQASYFMRNFCLVYFERHKEDLQTSFYNLSFGIRNQYVEDISLGQGYHSSILDVTNIKETNKQIAEKRPFFNCLLSEQQVEYCYLKPSNDWEFNCLEFIIYDESNSYDDLIYFWNRALSQKPTGEILQIIASKSQLGLMMTDENFGILLHSISRDNKIYLHSLSVESDELEEYRASLQTAFPIITYCIAASRHFPRIANAESYPYRNKIIINKNLMLGEKDHLKFPTPKWNFNQPLTQGTYIYDAKFYEEHENSINYNKFPYGTPPQLLIGNHEARVNKNHHISLFLNSEKQSLDINFPTVAEIFRSRLKFKLEFGKFKDLPVKNLRISDAGLKLSSFINLFHGNLHSCHEILNERFWVDLILGQSTGTKKKNFEFNKINETEHGTVNESLIITTPISNIHNNDGTFNHLDIEAERKLIYLENSENIRKSLATYGAYYTDEQLIEFFNESANDDFEHDIDPTLQYLINQNALFMGMKVKCPHCGSKTWYPLTELKNKMNCKGCLETIIPALESRLYYRFNDIVYNNLSSDPVKRQKNYHGNYIVLRTLFDYGNRHISNQSFHWSPSLDIEIKSEKGFTKTDIDIAIISQGKLIIGEAKASASDFNTKQFDQLLLMAEAIQPDHIILAYLNGTLNSEKLRWLKNKTSNFGCEIITHKITPAQYNMGRVR